MLQSASSQCYQKMLIRMKQTKTKRAVCGTVTHVAQDRFCSVTA